MDLSNSRTFNLKSIQHIAKNCVELTVLNLESTNILEDEAHYLVQNLTPKLKRINLGTLYNKDPDKHIKILVERCDQLQEIHLKYYVPITDSAITSIEEELKNTLETIELYPCRKISYSKLLEVLQEMTKLKNVQVHKFISRPNEEIRNLRVKHPDVEINEDEYLDILEYRYS